MERGRARAVSLWPADSGGIAVRLCPKFVLSTAALWLLAWCPCCRSFLRASSGAEAAWGPRWSGGSGYHRNSEHACEGTLGRPAATLWGHRSARPADLFPRHVRETEAQRDSDLPRVTWFVGSVAVLGIPAPEPQTGVRSPCSDVNSAAALPVVSLVCSFPPLIL